MRVFLTQPKMFQAGVIFRFTSQVSNPPLEFDVFSRGSPLGIGVVTSR